MWDRLHPDCQDPEYIRLVVHYYAKVLFNLGAEDDEMGASARRCLGFMGTLLCYDICVASILEQDLLTLAGIGDTASVVTPGKSHWKAEAVLYAVSVVQRHLTTDFPLSTTEQQSVFSVFVLIDSALKSLPEFKDRLILQEALRHAQAAYEAGEPWDDIQNLSRIPTRAVADAIFKQA